MGDLVAALDEVRRIARTYAVISSAESVFRLFTDMISASRAALGNPGPNDEITWFLLQRFLEDRIREFVHAYREDLGLGRPVGGPKDYPIVKRPWPLDTSETILRAKSRRKLPSPVRAPNPQKSSLLDRTDRSTVDDRDLALVPIRRGYVSVCCGRSTPT